MNNCKRIIYYYKTFVDIDNIINLEDVVTHIHLSSIHFRLENNKNNIYLNDNNPLDKCYNKVWEQLASYKKICKGKVILMIDRENGLSNLFEDFDIYYNLLKSIINKNKNIIDGVDLYVDENIKYTNIKKLICFIKLDFGIDFIITMNATNRELQKNTLGYGMEEFSYKKLYKDIGHLIDYFNCKFYDNYNEESYDKVIDDGYDANKIVMGNISSNYTSNNLKVIETLSKKYLHFGGVFNWEYYDAPPNNNNPALWSLIIKNYMNE